jgi:hypothetical protein
MTTVGLPDTSTHTTIELVSCLVTPPELRQLMKTSLHEPGQIAREKLHGGVFAAT